MTCEELYDELKKVAIYFGVGFRGFDQVEVTIYSEDKLKLSHGGKSVLVTIPRDGDVPRG